MRLLACVGLALLAGAALAQDHGDRTRGDRNRGDRYGDRNGYQGRDRSDNRRDRDNWNRRDDRGDQGRRDEGRNWGRGRDRRDRDDWNRNREDRRWRDRDRGFHGDVFIGPPVAYGDTVFDLQCDIDNLSIELTNLRRGEWFEGRDRRCHDLEVRIRSDRDRIRRRG